MTWLMAWWKPQAARIDAISLRERILVFATVLACLGAVANWAWLSPVQSVHAQLLLQLDQQATDLQKASVGPVAVARSVATDETARNQLAEVKSRLVMARQSVVDLSSSPSLQATPLTELLVHLLHQHDGLTLLRTATMSTPAVQVSGAPAAALPEGLVRQGVELTVTGSYGDLTRYVQTLEQALPQVRWGTMWLRSEKSPPELTLQLDLVEAKKP